MKITHFAHWGCRKSGLFECAKDQIKYERKAGHTSLMTFFPEDYDPKRDLVDDGWLQPSPWSEIEDSDIFVIHSGLPAKFEKTTTKRVLVIHGTVEFIMVEEVHSRADKTGFNQHINLMKNCDAAVSVNPHDYDIYKIYDEKNHLEMIHDAIDVEKFDIGGYQHPYRNHPQILYCDSMRFNKHPAHAIWAMPEVRKRIPNARLSVLGLDFQGILTWRNLILRSPNQILNETLENTQLLMDEVRPYMRGADILINGNMSGIPSRVELEAMACGCQVISYAGDFAYKYHPKPFDIKDIAHAVCECWDSIKDDLPAARQRAREWVLKNANMEKQVVEKYIPLYEKVIKGK